MKPVREVCGEILALSAVIQRQYGHLTRSDILDLIAADGTAEGSARKIADEHIRRIAHTIGFRSSILDLS